MILVIFKTMVLSASVKKINRKDTVLETQNSETWLEQVG